MLRGVPALRFASFAASREQEVPGIGRKMGAVRCPKLPAIRAHAEVRRRGVGEAAIVTRGDRGVRGESALVGWWFLV